MKLQFVEEIITVFTLTVPNGFLKCKCC